MTSEVQLRSLVDQLAGEIGDSKNFRLAIETLLKAHRNILQNLGNEKYYALKLTNPKIADIWRYKAAKLFLKEIGWIEEANSINFAGEENLQTALKVLTEYRLIAPSESEWISENKVEDLKKSENEETKKRELAATQRDKELAEFFKDKKEREKIAADIKKQIRSDQEHRRVTPRVNVPQSPKKPQPVETAMGFATPGHSLSESSLEVRGQGIRRQ